MRLLLGKYQKFAIYSGLTIFSLYSIALLILRIIRCRPVDHYWNPDTTQGQCLSGNVNVVITQTHAVLTGCLDLMFAAIAVYAIWDLKMSHHLKIITVLLSGLFALYVPVYVTRHES